MWRIRENPLQLYIAVRRRYPSSGEQRDDFGEEYDDADQGGGDGADLLTGAGMQKRDALLQGIPLAN